MRKQQYKPKYSLTKIIFIGKDPLDRKHVPKIIEYFWLGFCNFLTISISIIIFWQYYSRSGNAQVIFSEIFEIFWNKLLLAAFIGNILTTIASGIRLLIIQRKTEEFKIIAKMCALLSFTVIGAPVALVFSFIGYSYNEIEFV